MKIRIAFFPLSILLLCARVSRAQEPDAQGTAQTPGSQGGQDCLAHPEAAGCQRISKPAPGTKTPAPSLEQLPATVPVISTVGTETAGERGKPATAKAFVPPEPPPPTEFQLMVADSVGKMLPIYGASLFRQPPSTFAPLENVPVPADYVIGPGDELFIRLWGQLNVELRVTVDRNGQVFVPKVGAIPVAGVHVSQLDAHFRQHIERIYRNFDLTVTLGELRSIGVFFVGEARRPGTYTISSLSTLVNAIFATGGPAPQGSMRHIQLKRDGQLITEFDLYDLLLKGDKSKDVALLPGDVVYIPPAGPQVAIAGSVNTPSIYELKNAETSLSEAIELAGGLDTVADGGKVTVERIDRRQTRSVREFSLDAPGARETVKDGDIVRVLSIVPRFENAVTLRGNVANPGRYPWHSGMKIRDLLPDKEMLLTRNYWQTQNALVTGAGTQYEKPPLSKADQETLRTDVKLNAPEINWDYAVIQRLNPVDLSTTLIPFSLGKAVLERDEANNLGLQPGDVVTIFSQHDIPCRSGSRPGSFEWKGKFACRVCTESSKAKRCAIFWNAPEALRRMPIRLGCNLPASRRGWNSKRP